MARRDIALKPTLQFRRYRVPFRAPVRTAHGTWSEREGVLVRIEDGSGAVGYGECAPVPAFGGETVAESAEACRGLGGIVDDDRIAALPVRLRSLRNALASARDELSAATAPDAGDTAAARAEGAKYLALAALVPAGRLALREIPPKAEMGFRVFKWKVGVGDVADELALLDDVCAALPSGAKLRLDANGAWDRRRAERWLEHCAERPIEFVEQPIAAGARGEADLLLGLAHDYPTPLALDESLVGDGDIERWLGAGWPGIFVLKPSLVADVPAALARLAQAKANVVFSSALETAIGARAALRTALAWPGEPRAAGFGVWPLFADQRFDGPAAVPFLRAGDIEQIKPDPVWNALAP